MTQPNFSPRFKQRLLMVAALILLVAIAAVLIISSTVRQQYDTLLATTIKPTLSPPVLSFQATESLFPDGLHRPEVIQLQQRLKALGIPGGAGRPVRQGHPGGHLPLSESEQPGGRRHGGRADPVRPLR